MVTITTNTSKNLMRTGAGFGLAVFIGLTTLLPTVEASTHEGINATYESAQTLAEGEVMLMTQEAVQIPLPEYRVTQKFHWGHTGLDLAVKKGTPIRPVRRGIVTSVEKKFWGYGYNVTIQHGPKYQTLYAHMSKINVQEGDVVTLESVLGESGSTGLSTGPHLHLELRQNDKVIDPNTWLDLPELAKKPLAKKVVVPTKTPETGSKLAEDKK